MKKFFIFSVLVITALLQSCKVSDDENVIDKMFPETKTQKLFASEFTEMYGAVSPEITWMTVTSDTATVDVSALPAGNYTVQIYTADPRADLEYCYLLSEFPAGNKIAFDYPTGLNQVYAAAIAQNGSAYVQRVGVTSRNPQIKFSDKGYCEKLPEQKAMSYRLMFEGFTGDAKLDFDYNDIVVGIEYVRGHNTSNVTLLAAGCDCDARLVYHYDFFDEEGKEDDIFAEAHASLGFPGGYSYYYDRIVYEILNTGKNNTGRTATVSIQLNDDAGKSITEIAHHFYAYFTISPSGKHADISKGKRSSSYLPHQKGSQAPQALLITDPTIRVVFENMRVSTSFSLFKQWIVNPKGNPFWYGGDNWKKANEYVEN